MKYQVLFSLKTMKKYIQMSSAAVVIGASMVKRRNFDAFLYITNPNVTISK